MCCKRECALESDGVRGHWGARVDEVRRSIVITLPYRENTIRS